MRGGIQDLTTADPDLHLLVTATTEEAGHSWIGHHGGGTGRWIDAHEFVAAQ